jgi:hypothetical protein
MQGIYEGIFKRYENFMKNAESRICSIVSAEGSLLAVRKSVFVPLPLDCMEDVQLVYSTVMRKKKAVYEENAASREAFSIPVGSQIARRGRIVSFNLAMLRKSLSLLNPLQHGFFSFQLLVHKVFRWLSPFFLLALLVLNALILQSFFFKIVFLLQLCFYAFALLHLLFNRLTGRK